MEIKRLSYRNKNNKFLYYLISHLRILIPSNYYQQKLPKKIDQLKSLDAVEYKKIISRVNYYNYYYVFDELVFKICRSTSSS